LTGCRHWIKKVTEILFINLTVQESIMSQNLSGAQGEISKEKLMQDLQLVVSDAEELLRATAGQAGEKVSAARERIQDSLSTARARLADAEEAMLEKTRQAARATDEYVHENPWRAVGIAAGVGLVVGMLISRGR
jgi:ElaB/YqjD/DUF883 family membrane-anchored ribosome-binding protein